MSYFVAHYNVSRNYEILLHNVVISSIYTYFFQLNEVCGFKHVLICMQFFSQTAKSWFRWVKFETIRFVSLFSIVPLQFPGISSCHWHGLRTQEKRTLGPYNCSEKHIFSFFEFIWANICLNIEVETLSGKTVISVDY